MNPLLDLARRCERTAATLQGVSAEQVRAAAEVVRASVDRQIGQDIPLRRVAGGRVGVSVKTLTGGTNPRVLVKADGPMHLENNPTQPHEITVRQGRRSRGKGALNTRYGPFSKVEHPGTKGKFTWQHGVEQARPLILAGVQQRGVEILRGLLR